MYIYIYIQLRKQPPVTHKIGGLRNFAKFIGKHLRQGLFFNKNFFESLGM